MTGPFMMNGCDFRCLPAIILYSDRNGGMTAITILKLSSDRETVINDRFEVTVYGADEWVGENQSRVV